MLKCRICRKKFNDVTALDSHESECAGNIITTINEEPLGDTDEEVTKSIAIALAKAQKEPSFKNFRIVPIRYNSDGLLQTVAIIG